ncbi:NMT1/THI5 like domain protein [Methylocella silvestris BL2]|uniref:NMT1/THI5 like domain protein n=1 Tax=Methylocella silvestris (strain DSM 15510 / CIP 108128 / LMG 27833 / NCIMB 13906 / BL2) TaxID=395965 RepID=B8EQA3_METSB|nr:ABC transporter substrate-binding protein [Methylocella silvestris]ACK51593.1 NMT1/THI5 like domain protein [Methylocella silvestris BL2]
MTNRQDSDKPAGVASSRRIFIAGAAAAAVGAPAALAAGRVFAFPRAAIDAQGLPICSVAADGPAPAAGPLKKITFAWNAGAPCLVAVTVAKDKGFFARHGLDVDLINYSGSTDQLLETLATGKADAAIGMALRWLKPLEQGFDVKIIASTHGGCLRLLVPADSGLGDLKDLKGKTIAVSDMNAPGKNFFAIALKRAGLDPVADVDFKPFPGPLLRAAVEKGEAHAIADTDPNTFLWLKDGKFKEISSNLSGDYAQRACCIVGVRGGLVRDDRPTAAAIARALLEAADFAHAHPSEAAATYLPFAPGSVSLDDLTTLAKYHTHQHHPVGQALKDQLASYAEELKLVSVFKPTTDTAKYAARIYADVLS